jgi:putative redox protein
MCPQVRDARQAREQAVVEATNGADVRVGWPAPGDTEAAGRRISLDIGRSPGAERGATAALTPGQARRLAALLQQAATDGEFPGRGTADSRTAAGTASPVEVSYVDGESYAITTRGHAMLTDQPATGGGADAAMTPTELLVASLGSCVAFYAGRYLARHGLSRDGLHVTAAFTAAADRPARVAKVKLTILVPGGIPASRRAGLLAVAAHCTVHNTLRQPPDVVIELT